ncbi:MAG: DUF2971 domain-containing protein [Pseudomonadales bacterium]|nr:DUF2971 domain-containing protein [Pseudomonadales bacterium]
MRVYHFVNEEFGLKDLREKRLKISNIMALNDPFELFSPEMSNRDFRKAIKAAKKEVAKKFGVICFSANWQNPVQWAHYANRHSGVCLGFDVPKNCLEKITYIEKRVTHDGELGESLVMELLKTKYVDWEYEEEYRAFLPLEQPSQEFYYSEFSEKLQLARVIVGAESKLSRSDIAKALGSLKENVEVFKARPAFTRFEMVENKDQGLWA